MPATAETTSSPLLGLATLHPPKTAQSSGSCAHASQAKQLLMCPVPPQQFWLQWCGGVNVLDLSIVLSVLLTAFLWIQQLTSARWQLIDGEQAD